MQENPASLRSLLPFVVFLGLFLGTGIVLTLQGVDYAFYQLPASIAIIPAIIFAFIVSKQKLNEQISTFISGVGNSNIITMCLIYLLAGAFASVAKATGSVETTVNLGLTLIPSAMLLPGLFIIAAFLSTAMGTAMGTIAAIAPIALGISELTDINKALLAGVVLSGAMFGDNLSIISDTTIAAARTQGAEMRDKFKTNFKLALPAALICLVLFFVLGEGAHIPVTENSQWFGILPYLLILIMALAGVNVFVVLLTGIIAAALLGIVAADYSLSRLVTDINAGFASMQDIFILSLLIGGLSELIKQRGGIAALTRFISTLVHKVFRSNNQQAASAGISFLAFTSNFFTANNTVSIILSGETAKNLAVENNISPPKSASLLDIFACISQGLIPYGAQALLLGASLSISPLSVVSFSIYPMVLMVVAVVMIIRMK